MSGLHEVTNRRRGQRWALAVGAAILALAIVELGLRNIGGVFHDRFTQPDPHRGWSLKPGFSGWMLTGRPLWVRINSDGMRDREHALAARPGTVRIAILGDSYMQGLTTSLEDTFGAYLERDLTRCPGSIGGGVEVLNFGVSGYGTAQELLTYRHHAAKYKPQVVLLAFYTNNDVFNNHRRINPTDYSDQSPYFTLDGGRLVLDDAFRAVLAESADQPLWRDVRIFLTERIRVLQLLHEAYGSIRPYFVAAPPETAEEEGPSMADVSNEIYRDSAIPEVQEAWRVTEALLLALNDEVTAQGAELWITTLANAPQVDPDRSNREASLKELGVASLLYPDLRIRDFARRHGIRVITLAPALADYTAAHHIYLNGSGDGAVAEGDNHWTAIGNRIAAGMVATDLCRDSPALARRPITE